MFIDGSIPQHSKRLCTGSRTKAGSVFATEPTAGEICTHLFEHYFDNFTTASIQSVVAHESGQSFRLDHPPCGGISVTGGNLPGKINDRFSEYDMHDLETFFPTEQKLKVIAPFWSFDTDNEKYTEGSNPNLLEGISKVNGAKLKIDYLDGVIDESTKPGVYRVSYTAQKDELSATSIRYITITPKEVDGKPTPVFLKDKFNFVEGTREAQNINYKTDVIVSKGAELIVDEEGATQPLSVGEHSISYYAKKKGGRKVSKVSRKYTIEKRNRPTTLETLVNPKTVTFTEGTKINYLEGVTSNDPHAYISFFMPESEILTPGEYTVDYRSSDDKNRASAKVRRTNNVVPKVISENIKVTLNETSIKVKRGKEIDLKDGVTVPPGAVLSYKELDGPVNSLQRKGDYRVEYTAFKNGEYSNPVIRTYKIYEEPYISLSKNSATFLKVLL